MAMQEIIAKIEAGIGMLNQSYSKLTPCYLTKQELGCIHTALIMLIEIREEVVRTMSVNVDTYKEKIAELKGLADKIEQMMR